MTRTVTKNGRITSWPMTHTHTDTKRPAMRRALSRRAFQARADGKPFLVGLMEHFATRELQWLSTGTDKRLFSGGGLPAHSSAEEHPGHQAGGYGVAALT